MWGLAVVCVFAAYLGLVRRDLQQSQQREVQLDAELVGQNARMHLATNRDYLVMLASERARGFMDLASFQERAARFVADHPELICLTWVDADFVVTGVAPAAGNEQIVDLPLGLPEPRRASRLAMAERRPVYTRPFDSIQGARAFDLWVPVFSGDTFLGLFGAAWSYERFLDVVVGPELRERNQVSLLDADGRIVLDLHTGGPSRQDQARRVELTPTENGAYLMVTPYGRALSNRALRLVEILCLALVCGMAIAMWNLRREIDTRRRTERALRDSEAKARGLVENVGVGVVVISPEMEILEANRLLKEWFPGIDPGRRPLCYQAFCEVPREEVCDDCPAYRSLHDGLVHETTKSVRRDGVTRDYHLVSSPVFGEHGDVTAAIEIFEDVTERLAADARLRQTQKMEAVGRLAGGVAHDFNNMLQVILGHAELALDVVDAGNPALENVIEIRSAAERSAALVGQLLAFARKQVTVPKVLDLNRTIEGTFSMLQRLIGENIDLTWQPGHHVWPVRMDPTQLDQVLANLCVNARDAIDGVGRIAIETGVRSFDEAWCSGHPGCVPGDYAVLTVTDDGCGMDDPTQTRLFEPFFTTKVLGQGTGLGLATVYGIVQQNGGFIQVESEIDRGTTFRIHLPRLVESESVQPDAPEPPPPSRGDECLLLVEDEPRILDTARSMLEKLGYRVLVARSPDEALAVAAGHSGAIDLLVADVVMPDMNGRELSDRLGAMRPELRTLFISGYSGDIIAHHGILDSGVRFLPKPFSTRELAAAVREALGAAN